jgi:acyl-CoA thioesterase I
LAISKISGRESRLGRNTVNSLLVYHIGSGHAFFSGIALIQLAGLSAFLRRGRRLAVCRMASACAGAILVAVSSTPLPAWFYAIAGAVTLAWFALEALIRSKHRRLSLGFRNAMLATWWLGIALELPFHLMHAIPLLQRPPVFLVGDSLSAGIGGDIETWPKRLARSHHVVFHDLSRSGADTATAMRQAEQVNGSTSLVLVEIGGNDVLRATRPDAFEQALDVLLAKLRDRGRTIIMFELPLPPFHNRYGDTQRRLAARHGVLLIPKRVLIGVMTSEGATLDTIHLSDRGHALMAETVWDIIGRAM